jgi:hypothetical protein
MGSQTSATAYEQVLVDIVRKLPPERVVEVVDFARFIQWQTLRADNATSQDEANDTEPLGPGDEEWNRLFAEPESDQLLSEMAGEALEEYRAGRTTDITETEDGRLAPP